MVFPERNIWAAVCALACWAGCNTDASKSSSEGPVGPDVSQKARVLPKTGAVWGRDLALGLSLAEHELCRELDALDCLGEAHRITLGGVEPARLGIDEPLETTPVSAPIAADRVAISACSLRYALDETGVAVVFGPLFEAGAPSAALRAQVSEQLVERLLGRAPLEAELVALESLHGDLLEVSANPDRDWAVGACVVVATSTEALFY